MKAIFNNKVIAESNETIVVEGNHYFPKESLQMSFFELSNQKSSCPWKGLASYYTVTVDGKTSENAAWFYPAPYEAASKIKDYVAFWKDVKVTE